jgi:hypothetical protein
MIGFCSALKTKGYLVHVTPENRRRCTVQGKTHITLDALLNGDRTHFQLSPGDEVTPADITIAEVKELVVAINVSHERIVCLYQDLVKAEARIDKLEQLLSSTADSQEQHITQSSR